MGRNWIMTAAHCVNYDLTQKPPYDGLLDEHLGIKISGQVYYGWNGQYKWTSKEEESVYYDVFNLHEEFKDGMSDNDRAMTRGLKYQVTGVKGAHISN